MIVEEGIGSQLTYNIIGSAIEVHRALGPGLLESVYEECLAFELKQRGITFQRQVECPIIYREHKLNTGFRMDLIVGDEVIVELKAVADLLPVHEAQLLTYLRLANKPVGLLINFNVSVLKEGIKRLVL